MYKEQVDAFVAGLSELSRKYWIVLSVGEGCELMLSDRPVYDPRAKPGTTWRYELDEGGVLTWEPAEKYQYKKFQGEWPLSGFLNSDLTDSIIAEVREKLKSEGYTVDGDIGWSLAGRGITLVFRWWCRGKK